VFGCGGGVESILRALKVSDCVDAGTQRTWVQDHGSAIVRGLMFTAPNLAAEPSLTMGFEEDFSQKSGRNVGE